MGTDRDRAEVVKFWHAVELFSPQRVDAVSRTNRVSRLRREEPLPWDSNHPLHRHPLPRHLAWKHTVYLGVYETEDLFTLLEDVFPPVPGSYDERPAGQSAVAAFVVAEDGRPLLGSEVLSSTSWAGGRALKEGQVGAWLSMFDDAQRKFSDVCESMLGPDEDDRVAADLSDAGHPVGRPLGYDDLVAVLDRTRTRLQLDRDAPGGGRPLVSAEVRVKSDRVSRRDAHEAGDTDFLNSFVAPDLQRVASALQAGNCPAALRTYLDTDGPRRSRVDVEGGHGARVVYDATAPHNVPSGRWPAKPEHPLALSQQFAVNHIVSGLRDAEGLVGVNGPPGTGKTTMLRDLVAALVVERAERLARLRTPDDAFVGTVPYMTGDVPRQVPVLSESIAGFEMVVASSNNAAVENVTREVPGIDAVDAVWQEEAAATDYHREVAAAVLNARDLRRPRQEWDEAWGLVAAPLGNRRNCVDFSRAFWWGEDGDADRGIPPRPAMRAHLDQCVGSRPSPARWREAVEGFARCRAEVERLRSERLAAARAVDDVVTLRQRVAEADAAVAAAAARSEAARTALTHRQADLQDADAALARARDREVHHRRSEHPGVLAIVFSLGRTLRRWRDDHRPLTEAARLADQAAEAVRQDVARLRTEADGAERDLGAWVQRAGEARAALDGCQRTIDHARAELGPFLPDGPWPDATARRQAELHAPWVDPTWNSARSRLFLAALTLHKEFLAHTAGRLRVGLRTAIELMTGRGADDLSPEVARAAWQSLFLVVPVVSTTFASVGRLFSHVGPGTFGWLLVDEAGQATPQAAVGAMWRCRRTVAVGDPLQLEPIVSLPFTVQDAMRADCGIDRRWLPSRTSVQGLADAVTSAGTYLPGADPDEPLWVGAPLKVHRRCDEPMFGIVNDMVYGGLMVHATYRNDTPATAATLAKLPPTSWFDVSGGDGSGHWLPPEGAVLDGLLEDLRTAGIDMADILAIGPFRDVAREIERRGGQHGRFPGLVGGTIHRAQGREASVVVLVLGGDPARPGAKSWAASKPNLVNVAVSRARRRLYVIGNKAEWRKYPYFDTLAARLPTTQ